MQDFYKTGSVASILKASMHRLRLLHCKSMLGQDASINVVDRLEKMIITITAQGNVKKIHDSSLFYTYSFLWDFTILDKF